MTFDTRLFLNYLGSERFQEEIEVGSVYLFSVHERGRRILAERTDPGDYTLFI